MGGKRQDPSSRSRRAEVDRWWKDVLEGERGARHPVYGDELKVKLTDGRLNLSGEVPTKRDHDELVGEAKARIGNGLHELDASRLKVKPDYEKPGVLAQTLVAAFDHRDTADLALQFLLEHNPSQPLRAQILDIGTNLANVLPPEVVDAAKEQLARGRTLVAVDVDETEAFRTRSLLEEDTRSMWTVAAPPRVIQAETS